MSAQTTLTPQAAGDGPSRTRLRIESVSMRFAGVMALNDVSIDVRPREIHAVIGPNGAGKSTLFNLISGVYRPTAGRITLEDRVLTGLPPHAVAEAGVARTFQNLALFTGLSVEENLMLGRHRMLRSGWVATALRSRGFRREDARHRERVREIARFLDLDALRHRSVAELSYGERKRVEMARALSMEPRVLLLDEPVAGMDTRESEETGERVLAIREALDVSVVLVEHDVSLVMRIADYVTVLNFGQRISSGAPDDVKRDDAVIEAYLGASADLVEEGSNVEGRDA